jgi:transposase-like protein
MKRKAKRYPDELKFKVVQEYLTSEQGVKELMDKYSIFGPGTIRRWVLKFAESKPNKEVLDRDNIMSKASEKPPEKSNTQIELEARIAALEKELSHEKLRSEALSTLIEVAENELQVDIRKKPGAKQ